MPSRLARMFVAAALLAGSALPAAAEDRPLDYGRDIRPILSNNCYKCHGFDEPQRQSGLRLDTEEGMRAELDSGSRAVVPGKSAESELIARITTSDTSLKMPPEGSGKSLTAAQIELLKRWVDQGASWSQHWSFAAPQRPAAPTVKQHGWPRNAIDPFVLARLEREGLQPSAPADKVSLIRRVTLDLTGLPPTLAEVEAFVADESPDAYRNLVDRLLASERYGEHMARYWLDAVRYGDSHGLHFDNERAIWPYREWVIEAFNRNKPFDQFTVEQMAGDLLPEATREQKIASGYNRCNVTTSEGGSINEEVLMRYAVDRTEAMSTVWLGLTTGCAVCHDHKFDPVSQKEFYQLYAFFNAAADAAMDGNALGPAPIMKLPSAEQTAQLKSFDEQMAALRKQIGDELAKIEYVEPPAASESQGGEPREFVWIDDALPSGAQPVSDAGGWQFVGGPGHPVLSGEKSHTRKADALSQHFFTGANPGLKVGEGDRLFAYVWLDAANPPKEIMLQWNDGTWEHRATWGEDVIPWGAAGSPSRLPQGALPAAGQWVRLEVEAAKVGLKPGAVINGWAFTQHGGTVHWDKAGIVTRTPQNGQTFESLAAWDAYERAQSKSTLPQPVQGAIKADPAARSDEQKTQIRDYFLENVYAKTRPTFEPLHKQVADLTKQRTDLDNAIPITMIMADLPQPRETFVLIRGAYDKKGEKVEPGVPGILPPLPEGSPRNRLGLAKWLVDPKHPLTARVIVNRFWQQYFGAGLVETANDFGLQGSPPTHPDLLDWLAFEFVESGWDVKHMQKLIVMSAAYRQSSNLTPELLSRDPENKLLARGPRFRADAEVVRDTALAVSGLLVERSGGKSVKPYQPEGIWEAVGFLGSNTREYKPGSGPELYRRSLYTFWKRTAPPPMLLTFDAPSRETCTVRRARTNTPLQALALMNDEQYVEAARHLARRMMADGGATPAERIAYGFRLATSRAPNSDEAAVLARLYQEQLAEFQADKEAAAKLLTVGASQRDESLEASEHAAWTMVANVLLNMDETITKE